MSTIKRVIVIILSLNLLLSVFSFAQGNKTIMVKDENGKPIIGAKVILGIDKKEVVTNEAGEFLISRDELNTLVYVEAEGYETKLLRVGLDSEIVELIKMPYLMGEKHTINVPFSKMTQRQIPGAVGSIKPVEIRKYDEQNSVGGLLMGRVTGMFGTSNIRGVGSPIYVVNGVPTENLNIKASEIEEITVGKDLSTVIMYGSQANNGVILITTKRGSVIKKETNFTLEYGIKDPIDYPDYLPAADYMKLYNEALGNDGLDPKYSDATIESTRKGLNTVRFPDESYYNSTFLKKISDYHNFNAEISNGNEIGQFYLNAGWSRSTGLLKIGEGANEESNRFNVRSAVDYQINDIVDFVFNGSVIFNNTQGPRYKGDDFWGISTTYRPDIYPLLIPVSSLDNFPKLVEQATLIDNQYILGGTGEYLTNPYGELYLNGSNHSYTWLMDFNSALNVDLKGITKGLKAKGLISFENFNFVNENILNAYSVHLPIYTDNEVTGITKIGSDVKVNNPTVSNGNYSKRLGFQGILDYHRVFGDHEINTQALAFVDMLSAEGMYQNLKHGHIGLRASYMYSNKYIAEFTGAYAGSGKYIDTKNMYSFSPGIGVAWVLSEEDFLKNNSLIKYLKMRANWSILNTDVNVTNYNVGRNYYVKGGAFLYNDGGARNDKMSYYPGNVNLNWEKVTNMNFGIESMLLNYKLGFEASYFYYKNYDLIVKRENTLPKYFDNLPFVNYGSHQRQGVEVGLNYSMDMGDVALKIGSNFVYSVPKLLTGDIINYPDEYRKQAGKATDARFGYVALGLFKDQADIEGHAEQTFGIVQPGDIKYKDLNNDGKIDETDQMMIGNSSPRIDYGFNVRLIYKSFEFFALATGQAASDSQFSSSYYWVYGDRKYSTVVQDRWTPNTADAATYPRLSATSNPNNFRSSSFWVYKNNWFKIHTLQLNYTLSELNFIGLREVRLFLRGSNLVKLSKIKDKTNLNVGSEPQMRTASVGVNFTF